MRKNFLLAAAVVASLANLSHAFTITPTFTNGGGQTWTTSEENVVNEAIGDWTSILSYTPSPQNINITFVFTSAGNPGYLGLWQGNAPGNVNDLSPWTPQITHTININTDEMTGSTSLAFLNGNTNVTTANWDALSVLRHELGHALGFTTLYKDAAGTSDKYTDHISNNGTTAIFDPTTAGLNVTLAAPDNTPHISDTNDLMSVSLFNGVRKNIGFTDIEMLSLAYGYNVTVTAGTTYNTSTFKTQTITLNGTVLLSSTSAARNTSGVVLSTKNITFGAAGLLDLANHDLIISGGQTLASVRALVAAGFGTGTWNGTHGITSSTANAGGNYFGFATAGALGLSTFDGLPVSSSDILVKYTYLGDANLDGKVDLNDLNTVLNNLGTTTSLWSSGNFDGATTIDLNDLNDVLNHLGVTVPTGSSSVSVANALLASTSPTALLSDITPSSVPEPASLSLLALATPLLLRKRRPSIAR